MSKITAIILTVASVAILSALPVGCEGCRCDGEPEKQPAAPTTQPQAVQEPVREIQIDLDSAVSLGLSLEMGDLEPSTFATEDGRTGWAVRIPGGRPIATPTYSDGRLFVGGGYASHEFYCLDART
ncbi:MAG: hypothetical protein ACYTFO_09455, partial [Planctomycetota bacterium]